MHLRKHYKRMEAKASIVTLGSTRLRLLKEFSVFQKRTSSLYPKEIHFLPPEMVARDAHLDTEPDM